MLLFIAALIAATLASGVWCAAESVSGRTRTRWRDGRSVAARALSVAAVLGLAVGLRWFVAPPHHAMYLDEPWYAEAACNLWRLGRLVLCEETWSGAKCVDYEKAWGWPILLAPWTLLAGCATTVGIEVNRVIGSASVLLVAIAACCAGARWWPSIVPAALLAIYPLHVEWSATGETNIAAPAALLAGLCGALVYVRSGRRCGASLAICALGLATAIRPESFVPAAVAGLVLALVARPQRGRRVLVASAIVIVSAVAAVSGLQLVAMNQSISGGGFFSLENMLHNARVVARADSFRTHAIIALTALGGAAILLGRPRQRGTVWLLVCTAIGAALVALAYDRFHERMLLSAIVCLLPLSAFLVDASPPASAEQPRRVVRRVLLAVAAFLLLILFWRDAIFSVTLPSETQVLETRIAARVAHLPLSGESLFIVEQPPVLAAAGLTRVMSTAVALQDVAQLTAVLGAGRPVYFLRDMYCEPGFQGVAVPRLCTELLERFAVEPVAEEALHNRTYVLYRLSNARDAAPPPS